MRESNKAKLVAVFEAHGVEILNGDAWSAHAFERGGGMTWRPTRPRERMLTAYGWAAICVALAMMLAAAALGHPPA